MQTSEQFQESKFSNKIEERETGKSRSYSGMVICYEYCMKWRIISHWSKVHYGIPTEKKVKPFDFMMFIHMHICLREKKNLHDSTALKIKQER